MNQKKQRKFKININAKQGEQIGIRFSKNKLKIHGISDNRVSVSLYYEREEKKNDKVTTSYFADNNVQATYYCRCIHIRYMYRNQ